MNSCKAGANTHCENQYRVSPGEASVGACPQGVTYEKKSTHPIQCQAVYAIPQL